MSIGVSFSSYVKLPNGIDLWKMCKVKRMNMTGVEVKLHSFLIPALDACSWSTSNAAAFIRGRSPVGLPNF